MTFSVPIEKKVKRIDKDREASYRLQFMASALSNFVNNLAERIHKN